MRAPDFWWRAPGTAARLLAPAGHVYGALAARRMARPGARASVPVVCVGNFTAGGAGKTPLAIALAALLREAGRSPAFLSRGYGGRLAGPVRVDAGRHAAGDVGDEPLLLARHAPTVVARDRPEGAALCAADGADVIVMDDGFQNPSLAKDLCLIALDAATGFGNGLVLPAGPLRAPVSAQWRRADGIVLIGEGRPGEAVAGDARAWGLPALRASLVPDPAAAARLSGRRVLAFAGIGRPQKFFETLNALGADVAVARSFPDHHAYTPAERESLVAEASRDGLALVTTEKDLVRLSGTPDGLAGVVDALPVRLVFGDGPAIGRLLSRLTPAS